MGVGAVREVFWTLPCDMAGSDLDEISLVISSLVYLDLSYDKSCY